MFFQRKCRLPKKLPVFKKKSINNEFVLNEIEQPNVKTIDQTEIPEAEDKKGIKRNRIKKSVSEAQENN